MNFSTLAYRNKIANNFITLTIKTLRLFIWRGPKFLNSHNNIINIDIWWSWWLIYLIIIIMILLRAIYRSYHNILWSLIEMCLFEWRLIFFILLLSSRCLMFFCRRLVILLLLLCMVGNIKVGKIEFILKNHTWLINGFNSWMMLSLERILSFKDLWWIEFTYLLVHLFKWLLKYSFLAICAFI